MRHRIFIAITISKTLQDEIIEWEKQWQKLSAKLSLAHVRWLQGKNLHITLVPPWYEEDIESVKERVQTLRGVVRSFPIAFDRVTYGPDPRYPRLIWAEGEVPKEMVQLKEWVEEALRIRPERRSFRLHLTLARFRPETFSSFTVKTLNEKVVWRDTVSSFVLMESHLSSTGADYEILAAFSL